MKRCITTIVIYAMLAGIQNVKAQIPRQQLPVETMIKNHAALPNIKPYTGTVVGTKATPSAGNKTGGTGYFMTGTQPDSYFYYINRTGKVFANWGPIRDKYSLAGYEFGFLGWPADDEKLLPDGQGFFQPFDNGYIYWHGKYGAHIVTGEFFRHWTKNNWEKGIFGYPVEDQYDYPAGINDKSKSRESFQKFYNGIIYVSENLITHQITVTSKIYNPNYYPSHPH
jgi:hypothetical protein